MQETIEEKTKKKHNPTPLKQRARVNNKLDEKQLNKELAKKIIYPYYFTDTVLQIILNFTPESHHIIHANSKINIKPNYPEFGIEVRYFIENVKDLSFIFARLIDQNKLKYQIVFSARFDEQDEYNQVLDETEIYINLIINHNITESDLDNIEIKPPLEDQSQAQEMKDSGWRFDRTNSITVYLYKNGGMYGRSYVNFL